MAIKTNLKMQYERDLETYIIENVIDLYQLDKLVKLYGLEKVYFFVLGFIFKKTQVNFYIQEHFLKQESRLIFCLNRC